jgi:hypothetical protein
MSKSEYTFPYDTCEKVRSSGPAQPYSVVINSVSCLVLLYFLSQCKSWSSFSVIFVLLAFEVVHILSHYKHISGFIQVNIIHALSYAFNMTLLYLFYTHTGGQLSNYFITLLLGLVMIDLYAFYNLSTIYYLNSQIIIIISILLYYYRFLDKQLQKSLNYIIILIIVIVLLFINEFYNCKKMLNKYPNFPFHVFPEIVGFVIFYLYGSNFSKL